MNRSLYGVVEAQEGIVFITDQGGTLSVTNDAENVTRELFESYGDVRIIYQDSDGNWDELKHERGSFIGFAPYNGWHPV